MLALNARAFRALTLGEDAATSLGVDLERTRLAVVIGIAFGVGAAVAVAGSIGFVGLVAPHLVRRCGRLRSGARDAAGGARGRGTADSPPTSRCGSCRSAPAIELKVGVVTALIGVPFFLAMIFSERRLLEGAPS